MIRFLLPHRWRDRERLLFVYHDGRRRRSADPLVLWRALESCSGYRHSRDFSAAMGGDESKQDAALEAVCTAFGVEAYSGQTGQGMTVAERLSLLLAFDEFASQIRTGLGIAAIGRNPPPATFEDAAPAPVQQHEPELQQTGPNLQQGAE